MFEDVRGDRDVGSCPRMRCEIFARTRVRVTDSSLNHRLNTHRLHDLLAALGVVDD